MPDYSDLERRLTGALGLKHRPVAVTLGRLTCMALPAAVEQGVMVSTGCVGNRIHTDLGDDELYVAVRGSDLERVAAEVETIASANAKLAEYHRARKQQIATK